MNKFNPADYETVQSRIEKFWAQFPTGAIHTEIIQLIPTAVVKATIWADRADETQPISTGLAEEVPGDGFINKSFALENAETSAVGRALANLGLSGQNRPSIEEMQKPERQAKRYAVENQPAQLKEEAPTDTSGGPQERANRMRDISSISARVKSLSSGERAFFDNWFAGMEYTKDTKTWTPEILFVLATKLSELEKQAAENGETL